MPDTAPASAPHASATMTADAAALDFLLARRSRIAKTLGFPGPDRATVETILTAAARTPDHGKLEPWRFIVIGPETGKALGALTRRLGAEKGVDPDRVEKHAEPFELAPLCIAVVASPVVSEKVPQVEQILSAGAVCLAALNAALASGWGANWLTAWMAEDRDFLSQGLDLAETEFVAGFIHIGTPSKMPKERPRPDMAAKTTWRD